MMSLFELTGEPQIVKGVFEDSKGIHKAMKGSLSSSHNKKKTNTFKNTK